VAETGTKDGEKANGRFRGALFLMHAQQGVGPKMARAKQARQLLVGKCGLKEFE